MNELKKYDEEYLKMVSGVNPELLGSHTKTNQFEAYFAPPWNPNEFPEKTEGWIEFQKAMRENPTYYLMEWASVMKEDVNGDEE